MNWTMDFDRLCAQFPDSNSVRTSFISDTDALNIFNVLNSSKNLFYYFLSLLGAMKPDIEIQLRILFFPILYSHFTPASRLFC